MIRAKSVNVRKKGIPILRKIYVGIGPENGQRVEEEEAYEYALDRYKSVLYTSGDELVEVIFEILEKMLGCDLSEFTDKKKEDFKFMINDKVFIGEIKGVTPNVKKANVSQLDVHVQEHLDDNDEESKNIIALLIINHQRNKPISAREGVNNEVIKLAERNGSLIVETITLLKLFEQYLLGKKSRDECIDTLANTTGLLEL